MRRKARRGGGRQVEVTIESMGGRGDGVASYDGKPVFVPFALPGERVRLRLTGQRAGGYTAELLEIIDAAPERVEPPCPHYGPCGGCTVQHLSPAAYREWKQGQVAQALGRRGFADPPVAAMVEVGEGTRRRASLAATRDGKAVRLGFHGRESHRIESITDCRILTPALLHLLAPLREALATALKPRETADVVLLESETGVDLLLRTRQPLRLQAREALAELAETQDLARIAWAPAGPEDSDAEPEPVAARRPPLLTFGGVPVAPPPGAFTQPTAAGEVALIEAVSDWLSDVAGPVADFYAGCGTFAFPLAGRGPVHAVEGSEAAIAALWQAARKNDLAGRMTAEARDIAREPPGTDELNDFAAVVFDPPRAGAKALAEALAESEVPLAVAVSCNPHTFARDARILVDGGYELAEVRPIDQFPWSGHLELTALFRRG